MNRHSLCVSLICTLGVILGAINGEAGAAPLPSDAAAISAPKLSLMKKTGQGCGWDYPCPPVPDFGRRFQRRDGDIYIHNNYGPVNVYVHGRRPAETAVRSPEDLPCDAGGEGGAGCDTGRDCGGYPCDEKCGPLCWMRRFKRGYCGHGCGSYIEQSRIAAKEREIRREEQREEAARREERRLEREAAEESSSGCYYDYKGCPPRYEQRPREEARRWSEPPRYEKPRDDSLTPREPFAGPHYRDTCTDGGC
jgi:hypothetical protein